MRTSTECGELGSILVAGLSCGLLVCEVKLCLTTKSFIKSIVCNSQ